MSVALDFVCLSHLRWDFVYQRPQHLLSRCAREHRVFFVEEPVFGGGPARLHRSGRQAGVQVVVPRLPDELTGAEEADVVQRELLDGLLAEEDVRDFALWYYTPMAVAFTRHLRPRMTIYDCMDELSGFAGAPPAIREREAELFERADLVFTGGQSLYEAKRDRHPSVQLFPSAVDAAHFGRARQPMEEPPDQATIARPRLGYFGVIDERMDLDLLVAVAEAEPQWQLVLVGPVVKIDPAILPRRPNLHYLGGKTYAELPAYLAGWDVALLPFARNEATHFISPTKTPEYLAAGKPVVSTAIRDVIRPYGERGLVRVAETADQFVAAVEHALADGGAARGALVDAFVAEMSWDRTWDRMWALIEAQLEKSRAGAEGIPPAVDRQSRIPVTTPGRAGGG